MIIKTDANDSKLAVELTPMIDMVFLLLIFFLVATTFRQEEREMQIALPVASAAQPISTMLRELIINVDQDGRIIISGEEKTSQELTDLVTGLVAANPQQKVTVRGDRRTPYANIVGVLDICKAGGIQEPYLDTVLTDS